MFQSRFLSGKMRKYHGIALTLSVMVIHGIGMQQWAGAQMVGPQPPAEKPQAAPGGFSEKISGSLKKLFNPEAAEQEEETVEQTAEKSPPRPEYKRPPLISKPPEPVAKIEPPTVDPENPPLKARVTVDDPANPLGLMDALNKLKYVDTLVKENRMVEARSTLIPLRQWLIDATEAHINLYQALSKLPSAKAQAELEKQLALEFALLRDRSMLELGKVYIAEKEHKKAVKELVEVIKSQPSSQMGVASYQLLQQIGFTEKLQLAQ